MKTDLELINHLNKNKFNLLNDVKNNFLNGLFQNSKFKILLLGNTDHVNDVVLDHIFSFKKFSQNDVDIINPKHVPVKDLKSDFDIIILHQSIDIHGSILSDEWQSYIVKSKSLKVMIREDEYEHINMTINKFYYLGINIVISCLTPLETLKSVYDQGLDTIWFYASFPGYITDKFLNIKTKPIKDRKLDVVYRGRELGDFTGSLGKEKQTIGDDFRKLSNKFDLNVDISSKENKRIYGDKWPKFLSSSKTTLGVEGGSSIFDFNGEIRNLENKKDKNLFDKIEFYDGNLIYKTITPKFYEAICCKTALILFPGDYSNKLIPNKNYIPLERDFSNINEVIKKIKNDKFLQDMVDETFFQIVNNSLNTFKNYIQKLDLVFFYHIIHKRANINYSSTHYLSEIMRNNFDQINTKHSIVSEKQNALENNSIFNKKDIQYIYSRLKLSKRLFFVLSFLSLLNLLLLIYFLIKT